MSINDIFDEFYDSRSKVKVAMLENVIFLNRLKGCPGLVDKQLERQTDRKTERKTHTQIHCLYCNLKDVKLKIR